ncbi:PAS domain-containing sensor histidine kinase [Hyalangium rubrum]|uniref:histidine kinase n=1 Tax=Hyalangium rubrum TaxID=3103134 RepID=A0ABU5GZZ3_9BACT|nr:PAS domain S-box protein [Hyalangium sp. s54d21]MDY7226449.1 PAS domain S-box protein [Hyalangium sp. s54d21]
MSERSGYLEAAVEAAPLVIIGLGEAGTVLQWNGAAEQVLGWAASEVLGQVPPPALWGPDKQLTLAHTQALRGHTWRSVELELERRDGSLAVLSLSATRVPRQEGGTWGVTFIAQDITLQQNTLDTLVLQVDQLLHAHRVTLGRLQSSELNFRSLIERSPEAVVIRQGGRIAYVNPAGLRLLGYGQASELLGTDWSAVLPSEERGAPSALPGSAAAREQRLRRADGRTVCTELTELELEFDGQPSTVVLARDITERKEMQARLLLTDRLVSVGTLATGIAHEINNPMAYVTANLSELAAQLNQRISALGSQALTRVELTELVEIASEALEGAGRVNKIVRELKLFARGGDERLEAVDLHTVVKNSLKIALHELSRRARIVLELEEIPRVLGNESRFGQLCLNLLINAGQAIAPGDIDRNRIVVRTHQRGDGWVLLEVSDTGVGISPENQRRLFDPFFTTKPIGEGTGLGLSICHGIVKQLGGTIEVESAVGKGSVFRVALPPHRARVAEHEKLTG